MNDREHENYIERTRVLANTILKTQYIRTDELTDILKENEYNVQEKSANELRQALSKMVRTSEGSFYNKVEQYEYKKYYKYFLCFKYKHDDIKARIEELIKTNDIVESSKHESYEDVIRLPKVMYYTTDDQLTHIDLKFSLLVGDREDRANKIKYPLIVRFYLNEKLFLLKYSALPQDYVREKIYVSKVNSVRSWVSRFITSSYNEIDSFDIFEKINIDISNEEEHTIDVVTKYLVKLDDAFGGRINLRATDEDSLPIIQQLVDLAESFVNENDKDCLIDFVNNIEEDSFIISRGLKWHVPDGDLKPKEAIVLINRVYDVDNGGNTLPLFVQHHVLSDPINRERIDYVIKYISRYSE